MTLNFTVFWRSARQVTLPAIWTLSLFVTAPVDRRCYKEIKVLAQFLNFRSTSTWKLEPSALSVSNRVQSNVLWYRVGVQTMSNGRLDDTRRWGRLVRCPVLSTWSADWRWTHHVDADVGRHAVLCATDCTRHGRQNYCTLFRLERPQSRPHWLLLIYSFQFRSASRASPARATPDCHSLTLLPLPTLVEVVVLIVV